MTAETAKLISRIVASVVLLGLAYGLMRRRDRSIHIPVMLTCFAIDVANVLFIELSRVLRGEEGAVSKASSELATGVPSVLFVHIVASILSVLGYIFATWSGNRLYRRARGRRLHRLNAWFFVGARLTNYVTSFMV